MWWSFANIGEHPYDFRQLANVQQVYWRISTWLSPIGECPGAILANVHMTFANGESPVGESHIGELPATHYDYLLVQLKCIMMLSIDKSNRLSFFFIFF